MKITAEDGGEFSLVGITDFHGDFGYGQVGLCQHFRGGIHRIYFDFHSVNQRDGTAGGGNSHDAVFFENQKIWNADYQQCADRDSHAGDRDGVLVCSHRAAFGAGKVTAVIGRNGAGKSTLLRCLCGLERRGKGRVKTSLGVWDRKDRLKFCYMVMQDVNHQLFTESVLDEVLLSMPQEDPEQAKEILKQMDLLQYQDRHPMSLSGGQKQRVAVACAVVSKRPLVLFDEPTSGLDLSHMRQAAEVIGRLAASGRTVLTVTHDPEFILRCCDDVLHLEEGTVQESYSLEKEEGRKRLLKFFSEDGDAQSQEASS